MPAFHAIPLFFMAICLGLFCPAGAQNARIDSMELDLKHPKDDTTRITLLNNLAQEYYGYDTARGMRYLEQAREAAQAMHYVFQIANYYETKAKLLISVGQMDNAPLLDTAIRYYEEIISENTSPRDVVQSKLSIASCNAEKGIIFNKRGKFKEAVTLFLQAIDGWKSSDEVGKNEAIANLYGNISTVYFDMKQPEKALEYDKAAIPYRLIDHNDEMLAMQYLYVSDDFGLLSLYDSAFGYVRLARPLAEKVNKPSLNHYLHSRTAKLFWKRKEYPQAISFFKKSLAEAIRSGNPFTIESDHRSIAECYKESGQYDSARSYLLRALTLADQNQYVKEKLEDLKDLVSVEDATHHPDRAYAYLKQAVVIDDSIQTIDTKATIAEIENKYQVAQKEKEIIQLQKDKEIQALSLRHRSTLNYILIISLFLLATLAYLIYRGYRQKQQLQQQRIGELEKDRQLMAVDAMLRGQEEERSRLAKDLHDGLGGLLSGVKYSLNNMKENLIVTPDNMAVFERSLDMIDTSIRELRRVAHNMMPEMLSKYGLNEALKEYCTSINSAKVIKVNYQSFGLTSRLDNSVEIIIYRVIQELMNNILKHAGATEALVQLVREDGRLSILVEDNGKGFDPSLLDTTRTAGWTNIRSRVDYLKGRLDLHAEPGKGTSVSIEFNI